MSAIDLRSWNLSLLPEEQIMDIINDIDTIVTDCDGVLWVENTPIERSVETLNMLKSLGKRILLLTNNSINLRHEFLLKARKMGFDIEKEDIISSAYLAALYLKGKNFKQTVYVIGSKGIINELESAGIRHVGYGPDVMQHSLEQMIESFSPDPDVGAVIVGFDEHFCYTKLLKAASYLSKPSSIFLATNADERFIINPSLIMPGTGCIVRSVEAVAEREAIIVGKPYPFLKEALEQHFNIDPSKTLIIGDRCNTDVQMGSNCGFVTLLVLSGAANYLSEKKTPICETHIPTYYTEMLGDLLPVLSKMYK